jgi:hypothetical protein
VRCDLQKPQCQACIRLGFSCTWSLSQLPVSVASIDMSVDELRAFQHYREKTMVQLLFRKDDDFWDGALLRMSHEHRFLECFVIALSSLDEAYRLRTSINQHDLALQKYTFSLDRYQKGIEGLRDLMKEGQETELILSACLVCICVELWHGDNMNAVAHAMNGYQLAISAFAKKPKGTGGVLLTLLTSMLHRLCITLGIEGFGTSAIEASKDRFEDRSFALFKPENFLDCQKQFHMLLERYVAMTAGETCDTPGAVAIRAWLECWYENSVQVFGEQLKTDMHARMLAMQYHLVGHYRLA